VLTGIFTDSAVEGLSFSTATQSGITDAAGTFMYIAGETITFSIGGTVIGEPVTATGAMTPRDLVPGTPLPSTTREIENLADDPDSAEARAINRFVNIIVFLQSLDEDANVDNGITIPAGIATLLNGIQLDFDLDAFDLSFRRSAGLLNTIYQAASQGLLPTATIRKPGPALDHFYAFQGISHSLVRTATFSVDSNGDGTIDELFIPTWDADGNLTSVSVVDPVTGIPTVIETRTYDADGNLTRVTEDLDGDGNPDFIETATWDANGRPTMRTENDDGVGGPSFVETSIFDVNRGGITRRTEDRDGDGTIDIIFTHTYDTDGNRTSVIVDINADGTRILTILFDTDGNPISRIRDDGPDGIPNRIEILTYDPNGNQTSLTQDFTADGTLDYIETRTYDADGNVLIFTQDNNGDGTPESFQTSTYDANGNLFMFVFTDGAGTPTFTELRTYDAAGNLTSITQDFDADGLPDLTTTFAYDANGNLTRVTEDLDGDGNPDFISTITYDADGNETSFTVDSNGDGTPDFIETVTYEAGNWTSFLFEFLDED